MRVGPVCFLALALPAMLGAQGGNQASLGVGVGVVRHDQGSSFSAFTLAPAAQRISSTSFLGAGGALSLLEGGVWAGQARGDLWAARSFAKTGGGLARVALNVTLTGSTRSDGIAAGAGAGLGEVLWSPASGRGGVAVGAGAASGVIEAESPVTAFRARVRAWWQVGKGPAQLSLSAEGTRFLGAWYTDLVGGISIDEARVSASLWTSARVSAAYGSTGAATALLQYFLTPRAAIEVSGGNYLRDPFQGLPRAGFGAVGVRLHAVPRAIAPKPAAPDVPTLQPLIAQSRGGDTVVVRFRMEGARVVAIAGNWNAWTPVPLQGLGGDIWEAALRLPAGTYYFNLLVDETEWVVPGGVAVVSDGMGGLVAVLTVL